VDKSTDGQAADVAAPDWLSEAQRAVWAQVRPRFSAPTVQQLQTLEAYAVERARWLDAERHLQAHGEVLTLRTEKGDVKQVIEAPQVKIAARAQDRMLKLGAQLGFGRE
jgi:phage terminase small subunit